MAASTSGGSDSVQHVPQTASSPRVRPAPGKNNIWYEFNQSDTVLVFVHGIFSDSRGCWYSQSTRTDEEGVYWPELILSDKRIGPLSIFLGGYYTAIDAEQYDVGDSAEELFSALKREDPSLTPPPLTKGRIIFICHSTGGIVVRYLLDHHYEAFKEKTVGLALIASPSYGSVLANRLSALALFYNQQLGLQLRWGNTNLQLLDERFRTFVEEKRIPRLFGVEAFENHFIVHRKFFPDRLKVVDEQSAGRGYFGRPILLRNTNHFTTVKPDNLRHPGHELLVDFWTKHFVGNIQPATIPTDEDLKTSEAKGYFCYISRDKVDQLWDGESESAIPARALLEVKNLLSSDISYGRPDVMQRNARSKREYLHKLRRVLAMHAQDIAIFDVTKLASKGMFWYRGSFRVVEVDEGALMARVRAELEGGTLLLDCSLSNFSDVPISNNRVHFHSMNYAFFEKRLALEFETVFYSLAGKDQECYGSPLYLKLPITAGVVL